MEIFIKDGNLIQKEDWEKLISSIESPYDSLETNKERSKRKIERKNQKKRSKRNQKETKHELHPTKS